MKKMLKTAAISSLGLFLAGSAVHADDVDVDSDITTSTQWTADNVYHLRDAINVHAGATLSIEAGTRVIGYTDDELTTWAGEDRSGQSSVLVIRRGAKIMAEGTKDAPIVFTSSHDNDTDWRPVNSEWGNLTILGNAIIADGTASSGSQDGTCEDHMEGLPVDNNSLYGGTDDDDDSGVVRYVSLRYGGSVLGLANELNGLSMGGVGRETVLEHIEIMNNVDDGIEIWGGTSQLKYISIWNIGDDSLDLDEGYRGKVQFGLIVQGYGDFAGTQGSGVGDNLLEMDGGENPNEMQPYANPQLYNLTVIGQPNTGAGDNALSMRDNMRLQVGNSIFMDVGERLISFDETNHNQEMYDAFHTAHDTYDDTGVDFSGLPYSTMAEFYSSSRSGNWSWLKDCVFYNIDDDSDINWSGTGTVTTAELGLWDASMNNVRNAASLPIVYIERDTTTPGQPIGMERVISLDPRPANDALVSVGTAPADGFFTPAPYRGAFSPNNNWLEGWTAADAYGMLANTGSNPSHPADTEFNMTATTFFSTDSGVLYTVEESSDQKTWSPIATVTGDGSLMSVTDLEEFDSAKFYRAIAQ